MKFTFEDGHMEEKPLGAAICGYQRNGKRPTKLTITEDELDSFAIRCTADYYERYIDKLPATLGFNGIIEVVPFATDSTGYGSIEVVPLYLQDPDKWYIKEKQEETESATDSSG